MKKYFITAFIFMIGGVLYAQQEYYVYYADPNAAEREHFADITNMKVEVSFDVNNSNGGKVIGKVTHSFKPLIPSLDSLFFDGPDIQIKKAELGGTSVKYNVSKTGVTVYFSPALTWDKSYNLVFEYEAFPRKGLYFIGWDRPEPSGKPDLFKVRKQIWSQGQGIDNRYWIPMYDNMNDKYTTETVITFAEPYKVLSNGKLLSQKKNKDGTVTWNYRLDKPHSGYLVMLAIGIYEVKSTKTKRNTPVNFWYYPEFKDRVEPTSKYTERIIEFLEDETGVPYQWGSYSQIMVQDFLYGAMENTSATVFGDFFFVDDRAFEDRNYIGVNAHELTHQWFGDLITARSSNDIWMQENFATYYAKLFYGSLPEYGPDEMKMNELGEYQSAFKASESDNLPIRHTQSGSARAYPKGSAVLQMLRYVVGDEAFKQTIKFYLEKHAFQNVQEADFQNAFKDRLGMNLDWFFDEWILRGGEPHYKINWTNTDNATLITVEQIHQMNLVTGVFKMPIQFAVYYTDGSVDRQRIMIDKQFQQVRIPNPNNKKVNFVVFDENSEIMKKMTFERSLKELSEQALKAVNMADRLEAVQALASFPYSETQATLEQIINNNKEFHSVKAEAWKQWLLANKNNGKLPNLNLKTEHREVRMTLATHLNPEQNEQRALLEQLLEDNSYQVIETALDNLFSSMFLQTNGSYMQLAGLWLSKVKDLEGMAKSIKIKWLEYSIVTSNSKEESAKLLNELIEYSSADYEFRTRVNAFEALGRLNYANETVFNNMFEAISRPNSRLSGPTSVVYKKFAAQHSYKLLIYQTLKNQTPLVKKFLKEKGISIQ